MAEPNVLDWLARSMLRMSGMTPEQIRQAQRAAKNGKPLPKPKPKPGAGKPIGQTNLFNSKGQLRNFLNPLQSANRQPTLSPLFNRGGTPILNPGPLRPPAPGQLSIFGANLGQAPALPPAGGSGGSRPPRGTTVPQRGGPPLTPEQAAQLRRAEVASRRAAGNIRSTTSPSAAPRAVGKAVSGRGLRLGVGRGNLAIMGL